MELDELAYHVSRLYYVEGLTQQQIAKRLGISRPKVSRVLGYAREKGIVEIRLKAPIFEDVRSLSDALRKKLNLEEVVVAETTNDSEASTISSIARAAANYISRTLRDGQIVGWGWGRTMFQTIQSLHVNEFLASSLFVPMIGGAGQSVKFYQVNSLVERASEAFKARFMYLNAPAFFEDEETLKFFLKEKQVMNVIETWKSLDVAIFGLGKPVYDSEILRSEIDPSVIVELIRGKAVGDILARFFDKDGEVCASKLNSLLLGVDLKDLREVPLKICACGGREKVEGIIAASKKGYFNVLITDSVTASLIVEDDKRGKRCE